MFASNPSSKSIQRPSRRTFVKGLAIGGAAASVGLLRQPVWAQARQRRDPEVLTGTTFDLPPRSATTTPTTTGASR